MDGRSGLVARRHHLHRRILQLTFAKGAMPPLVLIVDDCRAAFDRMQKSGVEFTQDPVDRYGTVDAGFRDPSGNGWKVIQMAPT